MPIWRGPNPGQLHPPYTALPPRGHKGCAAVAADVSETDTPAGGVRSFQGKRLGDWSFVASGPRQLRCIDIKSGVRLVDDQLDLRRLHDRQVGGAWRRCDQQRYRPGDTGSLRPSLRFRISNR
jgi:hypothetical protein